MMQQSSSNRSNVFIYESPLSKRYASADMSQLFSMQHRYATWRKVWIALAKAEQRVGLSITNEQIAQMQQYADTIDFDVIQQYEKLFKHDVMANIHAYGDQCPLAKPIIHLGATSCTVTDNADLIIIKDALQLTAQKLRVLLSRLSDVALQYKDVPCLGFTHGQVAQPTTVGKRIAGWAQDFFLDCKQLEHVITQLQCLGIKGATGTQASFLQLVDGDHQKVVMLERLVAQELGFEQVLPISGQTYTRKQDVTILNVLSDIAISAHKMATDIRLLSSMREMQEPFGSQQVGSSAMPYKRNPMKCERVCSLARYIISAAENPKYTASVQWFERTLDDSANRRLCIPESFLAIDGVMRLLIEITNGLTVQTHAIAQNLQREFPFLAMEAILMECVQRGGDRQQMHEYIREHSLHAYASLERGGSNDLFVRVAQDERMPIDMPRLQQFTVTQFIGRAPQQVEEFVAQYVQPFLRMYDDPEYSQKEITV